MNFASVAMRAFGFVCQIWIGAASLLILYSIWGTIQIAAQAGSMSQGLMMAAVGIGIDLVLWFGLVILPVAFLYFSGLRFIPLIGRRTTEVNAGEEVPRDREPDQR